MFQDQRFHESFFRELTEFWRRKPTVWKNPFHLPYANDREVFDALVALRKRLDEGDDSIRPRVYENGRKICFSNPDHLPSDQDRDLDQFLNRITKRRKGTDTGMVIGNASSLSIDLWRRACSFLNGVYNSWAAR